VYRINAIALLFLASAVSAAPKAAKPTATEVKVNPDAARVAILQYEDKTGTKNFGYMPGSLQEAITSSMHAKFEFVEIDAAKVSPIAREIAAKNKGVIDARAASEICRRADVDILILGNFVYNEAGKEIQIATQISLGSTDKFFVLKPTENPVDATIFKAADKVAADIVTEITRVAQEQQKDRDAKGKKQLAKSDKSKTWADMNWNISPSMGVVRPLIFGSSAELKTEPSLAVTAMMRWSNRWHVGIIAAYGGIRSQAGSVTTSLDYGAAVAAIGYYFDLSANWRLTTLIGAGYYFGKFSNYVSCESNCGTTGFNSTNANIYNPLFVARSGIHYLLFSFMSLGVEADWRLHYDGGGPVMTVGGFAVITVVF